VAVALPRRVAWDSRRGRATPGRAIGRSAATVAIAALTFGATSSWGQADGAQAADPPGTSANVTAVSGVAPRGAVVINLGSQAQNVVNQHPPGTAFVLAAGVHPTFSVVPRARDRFFARPGAVLDGEHATVSAFTVPPGGSVNDVEVIGARSNQPLVIENYGTSPTSQVAAVQTSGQNAAGPRYSSGWRLQWLEVTTSSSRGISLSNDMVVLTCRVINNARLGIGGGGNGITIDDNTISDNGLSVARRGWEAGGVKTVASNVLIVDNQIAGNGAPGVWTDGGANDVSVDDNQISGNRFGVHVEISNGVRLTRNTIANTQQQAVLIVASQNVSMTDNTLEGNFGGVIVGGVGRVGPNGIHLDRVDVSGNSIVDSGTTGLHQPLPAGAVVRFDGNHYVHEHLQWDGHGVTFVQLQALGQESDGTWVRQ
jgi:parallel beta-helix repeat protein